MTSDLIITQPRVQLDDPHACTDSGDVLNIFGALFDALVRRGTAGWEPSLAASWTMSDDARTTTFRLREGVRFHDGEPCDAIAVKFCIERMARPDMGATLGAPGVYAQYLAGCTVETPDSTTVRLTTVMPIADVLDILAYGHIVSPRALAAAGDDLAGRAVGTGPYILESYEAGKRLSVRANPDHFDGPPTQASITWICGATAEDRLEALVSGQAHVANRIGPDTAGLPPEHFTVCDYLSPVALILMFNCAAGPASDPRVRLALNLAIDRRALVRDVLGGAGQPLNGYVSPVHDGFDPDAPAFEHDPARAHRLLVEAGYGQGLVLNIYCPTRLPDEAPQLVSALERQLEALGVTFICHVEEDRTRYGNQVRLKNIHDICVFDSSPMSAFRVLSEKIDARVKGSWWEGYHNAEIERLLDIARRTVDHARRMAVYRQIYRLLQQDPPWLYVYNHRLRLGLTNRHPGYGVPADGVLNVRRLPQL
jgi:peptide/nickel transport system substrate-binding protein